MTDPYGEHSLAQKNNFAIIGVGGYVAPKHLQAIKNTNNNLVAAMDINDSVGILDKYFIDAKFFKSEKDFSIFIKNNNIHYVSICSPNYLHKYHIELCLNAGCNVICEKPLTINTKDLDDLINLEIKNSKKIHSVLQLRLHKSLVELKDKIHNSNKKYDVKLKYITPRGDWYFKSWKNNYSLSGGILFNIGIHFFDILLWLFGNVENFSIEYSTYNKVKGNLNLKKANVDWFLSLDYNDLYNNQKTPHRLLKVDNESIDLNSFFTDLHTEVYKNILKNSQFLIQDIYPSIKLVCDLNKYLYDY